MKHRKFMRLCCLVLLLVLLGQSLSIGAAAVGFSDVNRSDYYAYFHAINYVSDNGYMAGTGSGKFSPDVAVDRGMFVTVLYSFAGKPSVSGTLPFTDVSSSDYYYNAVRWAYANGVVSGSSDTTFSPNMIVTREQAMVFLRAYATQWLNDSGNGSETITSAGDYSNISTWARTAMAWSLGNGILIRSNESSSLYPKAQATRKELALWICCFGQNVIGLDPTKDVFSFVNQSKDFRSSVYGHYLISDTHYNRLLSHATAEEYEIIEDARNESWSGSCYGMSLSIILDKNGQIDFDGNYATSCGNMYEIPSLRSGFSSAKHIRVADDYNSSVTLTQAESAINYYMLSQNIKSIVDPENDADGAFYFQSANNPDDPWDGEYISVNYFMDAMEHGGIALFCIPAGTGSTSGHSIIVYGRPQVTHISRAVPNNITKYTFSVYDPDCGTTTMEFCEEDGTTYTSCLYYRGGSSVRILAAYYFTSFDRFYALDIDGAGNATR